MTVEIGVKQFKVIIIHSLYRTHTKREREENGEKKNMILFINIFLLLPLLLFISLFSLLYFKIRFKKLKLGKCWLLMICSCLIWQQNMQMSKWMSEDWRMTVWRNEWMNEWMNALKSNVYLSWSNEFRLFTFPFHYYVNKIRISNVQFINQLNSTTILARTTT